MPDIFDELVAEEPLPQGGPQLFLGPTEEEQSPYPEVYPRGIAVHPMDEILAQITRAHGPQAPIGGDIFDQLAVQEPSPTPTPTSTPSPEITPPSEAAQEPTGDIFDQLTAKEGEAPSYPQQTVEAPEDEQAAIQQAYGPGSWQERAWAAVKAGHPVLAQQIMGEATERGIEKNFPSFEDVMTPSHPMWPGTTFMPHEDRTAMEVAAAADAYSAQYPGGAPNALLLPAAVRGEMLKAGYNLVADTVNFFNSTEGAAVTAATGGIGALSPAIAKLVTLGFSADAARNALEAAIQGRWADAGESLAMAVGLGKAAKAEAAHGGPRVEPRVERMTLQDAGDLMEEHPQLSGENEVDYLARLHELRPITREAPPPLVFDEAKQQWVPEGTTEVPGAPATGGPKKPFDFEHVFTDLTDDERNNGIIRRSIVIDPNLTPEQKSRLLATGTWAFAKDLPAAELPHFANMEYQKSPEQLAFQRVQQRLPMFNAEGKSYIDPVKGLSPELEKSAQDNYGASFADLAPEQQDAVIDRVYPEGIEWRKSVGWKFNPKTQQVEFNFPKRKVETPPTTEQEPPAKGALTVYQGTGRTDQTAIYSPSTGKPVLGTGNYYAFDEHIAARFGPDVKEHTLTPSKPLVIESDEEWAKVARAAGFMAKFWQTHPDKVQPAIADAHAKIDKYLKANGHDAVVIRGTGKPENQTLREVFGQDQVFVPGGKEKAAPPPKTTAEKLAAGEWVDSENNSQYRVNPDTGEVEYRVKPADETGPEPGRYTDPVVMAAARQEQIRRWAEITKLEDALEKETNETKQDALNQQINSLYSAYEDTYNEIQKGGGDAEALAREIERGEKPKAEPPATDEDPRIAQLQEQPGYQKFPVGTELTHPEYGDVVVEEPNPYVPTEPNEVRVTTKKGLGANVDIDSLEKREADTRKPSSREEVQADLKAGRPVNAFDVFDHKLQDDLPPGYVRVGDNFEKIAKKSMSGEYPNKNGVFAGEDADESFKQTVGKLAWQENEIHLLQLEDGNWITSVSNGVSGGGYGLSESFGIFPTREAALDHAAKSLRRDAEAAIDRSDTSKKEKAQWQKTLKWLDEIGKKAAPKAEPTGKVEPDTEVERNLKIEEVRNTHTSGGESPDRWQFVGCGKAKAAKPTKARNLYTGDLTEARMAHADASGNPWLILSAEHGLISPETDLAPYDKSINDLKPNEKKELAFSVGMDAAHLLGPGQKASDITIELHAGKEYVNLVRPVLEAQGFKVETPLEGKGIGQQLQFYKTKKAAAPPAPRVEAPKPAGFAEVFTQTPDFIVGVNEGRQQLLRTKAGDTKLNDLVTYTKADGSIGRGKVHTISHTTGEMSIDNGGLGVTRWDTIQPGDLITSRPFEAEAPEPPPLPPKPAKPKKELKPAGKMTAQELVTEIARLQERIKREPDPAYVRALESQIEEYRGAQEKLQKKRDAIADDRNNRIAGMEAEINDLNRQNPPAGSPERARYWELHRELEKLKEERIAHSEQEELIQKMESGGRYAAAREADQEAAAGSVDPARVKELQEQLSFAKSQYQQSTLPGKERTIEGKLYNSKRAQAEKLKRVKELETLIDILSGPEGDRGLPELRHGYTREDLGLHSYQRAKLAEEAMPGTPLKDIEQVTVYDRQTNELVNRFFTDRVLNDTMRAAIKERYPTERYSYVMVPNMTPERPVRGQVPYREWLKQQPREPRTERGAVHSVDPKSGKRYTLPDAIRNAFERSTREMPDTLRRIFDRIEERFGSKVYEVELPQMREPRTGPPRPGAQGDIDRAHTLAKVYNRTIRWVRGEGPEGPRGFEHKGELWLNADMVGGKPVHQIAAHELTHWLEHAHPDLYHKLVNHLLRDVAGGRPYWGLDLVRPDRRGPRFWKSLELRGYKEAELEHELTAYFLDDTLSNPTRFREALGENPGFMRRLGAVISDWFDASLRKLGLRKDSAARGAIYDLGAARDKVMNTLKEVRGREGERAPPVGELRFEQDEDPRALRAVAYKDPKTGIEYHGEPGELHGELLRKLGLSPSIERGLGFVTNKGEFLNRIEAWDRGKELRQIEGPAFEGKGHMMADYLPDPRETRFEQREVPVGKYGPLGAIRRGIAKGDIEVTKQTNVEKEFFGKLLPKMIRATGLAVRPSQWRIGAARLVKDIASYIKENKWAQHYYTDELDQAVTNAGKGLQTLGEGFGKRLTKEQELLFRMLNGINSNSTPLRFNSFESLNGLRLFEKQGNLDGFKMVMGKKGALTSEGIPQPYSVTGGAVTVKIGHLQKFNELLKRHGITETARLLREEVTWPELVKWRQELGWKSPPAKGEILEHVRFATGQDVMIPRAMGFGEKVGPYMLNNLGDLRYNTTDTWESRIFASLFKGMLEKNTGIANSVEEHQLFLKTITEFNRIWKEKYPDVPIPNAGLQALRWFFVIDTSTKAGYTRGLSNRSIAPYVEEYFTLPEEKRGWAGTAAESDRGDPRSGQRGIRERLQAGEGAGGAAPEGDRAAAAGEREPRFEVAEQGDEEQQFGAPVAPTAPPTIPPTQTMMGKLPVTLDPTVRRPGPIARLFGKRDVAPGDVIDSLRDVSLAIGGTGEIHKGRFNQRRYAGVYKPFSETIRLNQIDNIPTAVHEIGHDIAKQFYGSTKSRMLNSYPPPVKRELIGLGKALYGSRKPNAGYTAEGLSEFMRLYLTTDDGARQSAPATLDFFEKTVLKDHPEIVRPLQKAKKLIDQYRFQGTEGRMSGQEAQERGRIATTMSAIGKFFSPRGQLESGAPLRMLSKEARLRLAKQGTAELSPSQDPYQLFKAKRGTSGPILESMVEDHMTDLWGNPTGPSLREAMAGIPRSKQKQFGFYLWAKVAEKRWAEGKNPGISKEDATYWRTKYDTPEFAAAADKYLDWMHGILNYWAQADPTAIPLVDKLKKESFYAPLARLLDPRMAREQAARAQSDPTYRMHGSGLPVKNIIQQTLRGAERIIAHANQRLVSNSIIRLAHIEGMGKMIEQIPRDKMHNSVNIEHIRDDLEKLGVDTINIPDDTILEYYTPADRPKGSDPIISWKGADGKTRWYRVHPKLYSALEKMEPFSLRNLHPYLGPVLDMMIGAPKRLFTLGTTGLRPTFSLITNPLRDPQGWLLQTKAGINPPKMLAAYIGAMREALTGLVTGKPGAFEQVARSLGAPMSQPLGRDVRYTRHAAKGLFESGRVMRVVRNPVDHVRQLLGVPESFPRLAEMRRVADQVGWEPGQPISPDQAVQMALGYREATVDFNAAGDASRVINEAVPFYNPSVQGMRTAARALRDHPARTVLWGLAAFTAPAIYNWWNNKDKFWYRNLPYRERYYYNNIDDGKRVWQLPRPFEWSNIFQVPFEASLDAWYQKDPAAVKAALGHIFETQSPIQGPEDILGVPGRMMKEQWSNHIDFWDRPIVPRSELDLPPAAQVGPYTSKVAQWIGQAMATVPGMSKEVQSPRRIDAAMRSFFGGTAPDLLDALGMGAVKKDREHEFSDIPVIGRLARRGGHYTAQSQYLSDFWEINDMLQAKSQALGMQMNDPNRPQVISPADPDQLFAGMFSGAAKNITFGLRMANQMKESKAREVLYEQMALEAKGLIDAYNTAQKQIPR